MDYARPSLIGQVRSARNTVNVLRMPDTGSDGITKAVGSLVDSIGSATRVATTMIDEKNSAALAQKALDFESELTSRLDDIYNNNPADAVGATQDLFRELRGKYSEGLGGKWLDTFNQNVQRKETAVLVQARDTQRRYNQDIENKAYQAEQQANISLYSTTGSPELITASIDNLNNKYRVASNYGKLPSEDLADFVENIRDGYFDIPERINADGVKVPAQRLKIDDSGAPNTISEARIAMYQKQIEYKVAEYDRAKQDLVDKFHASWIDGLLKQNDVGGAWKYANGIQATDKPMSESLFRTITPVLEQRAEAKTREDNAKSSVNTVLLQARSDKATSLLEAGDKYLSKETEAKLDKLVIEAVKSGVDPDTLKVLKKEVDRVKTICKGQLQTDTVLAISEMQKQGKFSPGMIDQTCTELMAKAKSGAVSMLEQNILTTALNIQKNYESQDRIKQGNATQADIALAKDIGNTITLLSYMRGKGAMININGNNYDISTDEGMSNLCTQLGYTPQQVEMAKKEWGKNQKAVVECTDIATGVLNTLNGFSKDKGKYFTADKVLALAPEVVNYLVQNYKGIEHLGGEQQKKTITALALQFMKNAYTTEEIPLWFDRKHKLPEFLALGLDENGGLVTEDGVLTYTYDRWASYGISPETQRNWAETHTQVMNAAEGRFEDVREKNLNPKVGEIAENLNLKQNEQGELDSKEPPEKTRTEYEEEDKLKKRKENNKAWADRGLTPGSILF
jgi:hypothetical protein